MTDADCCTRCRNVFPPGQVCDKCRSDIPGLRRIVAASVTLVLLGAIAFAVGLGCYALFGKVTG